jgi:hypothetical protein
VVGVDDHDPIGDPARGLLGAAARCAAGAPLGVTRSVYVDVDSGRSAWVALDLGDPARERVVPLARTRRERGRGLVVDLGRAAVERAPLAPAADLGPDDEDLLFGYWAQVLCPVRGGPVAAVGADRRLTGVPPAAARLTRVTR